MYWNGGGNKAEWSAKPNKGVRAYCDNDDWGGDDWGGDDWGGDDWGGDEHPTMEPSKHMFCFFLLEFPVSSILTMIHVYFLLCYVYSRLEG